MPAELKDGELNRDFGLYVNRPFYIVNRMTKGRYLQQIGGAAVVKMSNGYDS